jgi:hypothetical protein
MAMQVFVPMPDEGLDALSLAGVRLVPYRPGMALWANVGGALRAEQVPVKAPAMPAAPADRLP